MAEKSQHRSSEAGSYQAGIRGNRSPMTNLGLLQLESFLKELLASPYPSFFLIFQPVVIATYIVEPPDSFTGTKIIHARFRSSVDVIRVDELDNP